MKRITLFLVLFLVFGITQIQAQYCAGGPTFTGDSNIQGVTLTGVSSSIAYTGCPGITGVENQTAQVADLIPGNTYTMSVTFGTCGGNYGSVGEAWIDWDNSGTFDATELIGSSAGTPGTAPWDAAIDFTFTVPTSFVCGTRMRVMQQEGGTAPLDPCATYNWGSIVDFTITESGAAIYTYYADTDSDTYGDAANSITDCNATAPAGYTADSSDCDDTDPTVNVAPNLCPVCTAGGSNVDGTGITNVTMTNINNTSTNSGTAPYYEDFTGIGNGHVYPGTSAQIDVTHTTGRTYYFEVWIDWNKDNQLNMTDEYTQLGFGADSGGGGLVSGLVSVPPTAVIGDTHLMRIIGHDFSYISNPCYSGTWAEVEDYTVEVLPVPACLAPTTGTTTAITDVTADIAWTDNSAGSATGFNIEYGVAPYTQGGGGSTATSTMSMTTLTGLMPNTNYEYYIQADCGSGTTSTWVGPFGFTTACAAFNTFPACTDFSATVGLDNCWATYGTENWQQAGTWPDYGAAGQDNTGWIGVDGSGTNGADATLQSPLYDLTAYSGTNPPQVSFDIFSDNTNNPGDNALVTVEITTDGGSTWSVLTTFQGDGGLSQVSADLSAYTSNIISMRVIVDFTVMTLDQYYNDITINNFCVEEAPLCPQPGALSSANITDTSADLAWNAGASETLWNIEIVPVGTAPTGTGISTATIPFAATGLMPQTGYEFYVQADCAANGTSSWVGPFAFTTLCAPFLGDDIANPIIVTSLPYTTTDSTSQCFTNTTGNISPDAFYEFTTDACSETTTVSLCGSLFDTYLRIYDAAGAEILGSDDDCGAQSEIITNILMPNTTYYAVVEGFSSSVGVFTLNISQSGSPIGGTIATTDPTTICVDGTADPINVTLAGEAGDSSQWVITDVAGNILGLPAAPPFDLDPAGPGTCVIWHLSYNTGLTGAAVGNNATTDLVGCYDLSNPITVVRNEVQGGTISTTDPTTICVDGTADPINVALTGEVGDSSQWVITDTSGEILGLPAAPPFDLDPAGPGTCVIWHLSYNTGLTGAAIGNNATTDLVGCYSLSNPITVVRNEVQGGTISTSDPTTICVDGVADPINVTLTGEVGDNSQWVITDTSGEILGLPIAPPFNLDPAGPGTCVIWHLSYNAGLTGAAVGNNATTDLMGCYALSNPITVVRNDGPSVSVDNLVGSTGADGVIEITVTGNGPFTYSWDNGDTTEDLSGLAPGDYTGTITDANGCTLVAGPITVDDLTSNNNITNLSSFKVYPNPTRGTAFVELEFANVQNFRLEMTNALGQVISSTNYESVSNGLYPLETQNLSAGIYFVRIISENNEQAIERLMIQR